MNVKSAKSIRSRIVNMYVQPKTMISAENKKLRTYQIKVLYLNDIQ